MKKKIIYGICAAVVVVAVALCLIFVFSGNIEVAKQAPNFEGTWMICANYTSEVPAFNENQFIVFKNETVKIYKDDLKNPYATSKYIIDDANNLVLSDIDRKYLIDKKTDNCIRLYENAESFMLIVKNNSPELAVAGCTANDFKGSWNVVMKGSEINMGDSLAFAEDSLEYYRASAPDSPATTSTYNVSDDSILTAQEAGLSLKCYKAADGHIVMLDKNTSNAWEIAKK